MEKALQRGAATIPVWYMVPYHRVCLVVLRKAILLDWKHDSTGQTHAYAKRVSYARMNQSIFHLHRFTLRARRAVIMIIAAFLDSLGKNQISLRKGENSTRAMKHPPSNTRLRETKK